MYQANGTSIDYKHPADPIAAQRATCATPEGAAKVVELLNRARRENDVLRHYTKAARLIAEAEAVEGFEWTEDDEAN